MQKINAFLIVIISVIVGAVLIVALLAVNKDKQQDRFSVSGKASVYAKADIANINIGIKTETKKTSIEATKDAEEKMSMITEEIKKLNIEEKDIKTGDYNLNPVYNWTEGRGQELVGYEVVQTLTLKIRDLNVVGDVIARTTEKGANQIGSISFTIDDEFALKNQARELAIQKAKEKAVIIAKQSGMKLGEIKNVTESDEQIINPMYTNVKAQGVSDQAEKVLNSPQIQTGQNEIRAEVTLIYEVK